MKKPIFVLMPFSETFIDIYELGIKLTCEEAGTTCERVDEQIFKENIVQRIYSQIRTADLLIADMTGKNPNVFYEVGYAHVLDKNIILLTQNADDIPFDLKGYPHIIYDGKASVLRQKLKQHVYAHLEQIRAASASDVSSIKFYITAQEIVQDAVVKVSIDTPAPSMKLKPELSIHNEGEAVIDSADVNVSLIAPLHVLMMAGENATLWLPDGRLIANFRFIGNLYPKQTVGKWFEIELPSGRGFNIGDKLSMILRVFSKAGPRDINFTLIPVAN